MEITQLSDDDVNNVRFSKQRRRILEYLYNRDYVKVSELKSRLKMSTVHHHSKVLKDRKFINESKSDKKTTSIKITDRGKEVINIIKKKKKED